MSKKSRTKAARQTPVAPPAQARGAIGRKSLFIAAAAVLLAAFAGGALFYKSEKERAAQQLADRSRTQLASAHSPMLGNPDAKVHVVEFLDPACETCAVFYPHVKKLMADNPGRIRLSVRHVPFHQGSEHVVRMLEATRSQGKYWQALEAVFAAQDRWTVNHRVHPERVWPALEGLGLDLDRIRSEMNSPEIAARMDRDAADARALDVTKTPEYFVNGRPMPRFGMEELQELVGQELASSYR
jgi:protein-disulfide isomerase